MLVGTFFAPSNSVVLGRSLRATTCTDASPCFLLADSASKQPTVLAEMANAIQSSFLDRIRIHEAHPTDVLSVGQQFHSGTGGARFGPWEREEKEREGKPHVQQAFVLAASSGLCSRPATAAATRAARVQTHRCRRCYVTPSLHTFWVDKPLIPNISVLSYFLPLSAYRYCRD